MVDRMQEWVVQSLAAGAISSVLLDWAPVLLAVPAALFYCLKVYYLIQEKRKGS